MRGSILKWFKHFSNANKGNALQDLYDAFGVNEGHGTYFRFVEFLADKWDGRAEPKFRFLTKILQKYLEISPKKLQKFAEIMSKTSENEIEFVGNFCEIYFPKLLEVKHRDAFSSGQRPETDRPNSSGEKKKKKSNTTVPDFLNLESLLAAVPQNTQEGWAKLYPKEFIDRELIKAWNYYLDDKPKTLRGWSRALSGWLDRTDKWNKKDAANRAPETGGWEHIDGVS